MSNDVVKTADVASELTADNYKELNGKFDALAPVISADFADNENSENAEQRDKLNSDYENVSAELHDAIKNRADTADILTKVNSIAAELAKVTAIDTDNLHNDAQRDFSVFCINGMHALKAELDTLIFSEVESRTALKTELAAYVTAYDTAKSAFIATFTAELKAKNSEITDEQITAELAKVSIETAFDFASDAADKVASIDADLTAISALLGLNKQAKTATSEKTEPADKSDWVTPTADNNRYISEDGTAEFTCKGTLFKFAAADVTAMIDAYTASRQMKDVTAIGFKLIDFDSTEADENSVWNHLKVIVNHNNKHVKTA